MTAAGNIVSAIVMDFSEDLRDREDLSLEHLLKNAKILVGAISHEIRNLCGAAWSCIRNLSRLHGMEENQDFHALGALIAGLENLSAMELRPSWAQGLAAVELSSVLDELRVVIGPPYSESGAKIHLEGSRPPAAGNRGSLRLAAGILEPGEKQPAGDGNDGRKATHDQQRRSSPGSVVIRFEDTGAGIPDPSGLFRPFYQECRRHRA